MEVEAVAFILSLVFLTLSSMYTHQKQYGYAVFQFGLFLTNNLLFVVASLS